MGASLVAWLCQLMLEMAVSSLYRAHPGLLLAGLSPPHDLCKVCGSGPCGKISLTSADDGQTLCVLRWYQQLGVVEKYMAVVYSPVLGLPRLAPLLSGPLVLVTASQPVYQKLVLDFYLGPGAVRTREFVCFTTFDTSLPCSYFG